MDREKIFPNGVFYVSAENPESSLNELINRICNLPTADVVPKSEVEKLTVELDAMRGAANTYKMHYENAMKEIERLKDYNTGVAFKHYFDAEKRSPGRFLRRLKAKRCSLKTALEIWVLLYCSRILPNSKRNTRRKRNDLARNIRHSFEILSVKR